MREPTELDMAELDTPEKCKEAGNVLFTKKGDNLGAIKLYHRALELLLKPFDATSIGASVIVKMDEASSEFVTGMVSGYDVVDKKTEVCFDDGSEEGDIEASRIEKLVESPAQKELQRSCYLNSAKAYFKENKPGWSIRFSSLALAVSRVLGEDGDYRHEGSSKGLSDSDLPPKYRRLIADCLFIRGKACLGAGRHVTAQQHAELLCGQEIDEAKGKALAKDVHSFRVIRMKSNRKLAKHMGEWVEQAMELNSMMTAETQDSSSPEAPQAASDDEADVSGVGVGSGRARSESHEEGEKGGEDDNCSIQ